MSIPLITICVRFFIIVSHVGNETRGPRILILQQQQQQQHQQQQHSVDRPERANRHTAMASPPNSWTLVAQEKLSGTPPTQYYVIFLQTYCNHT